MSLLKGEVGGGQDLLLLKIHQFGILVRVEKLPSFFFFGEGEGGGGGEVRIWHKSHQNIFFPKGGRGRGAFKIIGEGCPMELLAG